MRVKRAIAVMLGMLLCLVLPVSNDADGIASAETVIWDGTYDTSWYDSEETELHISTAEELAGLSELVNAGHTMTGQTIYLDSDIYLNDVSSYANWGTEVPANQWLSIGKNLSEYYFDGVFDGQDHKIVGAYIDAVNNTATGLVGFFGITGINAVLCNLNFDSCYVEGRDSNLMCTAGICAYNQGSIMDCSFNGVINKVCAYGYGLSGYESHCGAVCAYNVTGDISGCIVSGAMTIDIYNYMSYVGGVCGYNVSGNIERCSNKMKIISSLTCATDAYCYTGGICGYSLNNEDVTISECSNYGEITTTCSSDYGYSGGICGALSGNFAITDCYNRADIISSCWNGGILGLVNKDSGSDVSRTLSNTYNTGVITQGGGGIIGLNSSDSLVMSACYYLSDNTLSGVVTGADNTIAKSAANMQKESFIESLGEAFVYNEGGYPLLAWEVEAASVLKGDVNLDGVVDADDVQLLQSFILGTETLTAEQGTAADMTEDGSWNAFDLAALKRIVGSNAA